MQRRVFLKSGAGIVLARPLFERPLFAMVNEDKFAEASKLLATATESRTVRAAAIYARVGKDIFHRVYGEAKSTEASFLLGSISKPIAVAALMTLHGEFQLNDPVKKFIPEFVGEYKDLVTVQHLLTHVSGLPDQLPNNAELRRSHASLSGFVDGAIVEPLRFRPGTRYEYSSMGILLAMEIARRISGIEFVKFVNQSVFKPLGMHHSAFGMGQLRKENIVECQVEFGAIESGGGSPDSKSWDWNSPFWRELGAPWGGAQCTGSDVAIFLEEFLHPTGKLFPPDVAKTMIQNHNPVTLPSRGLGFDVGMNDTVEVASEHTFGHTGSTGTIAWADPKRDRVCVVLTSLPANASPNHVRQSVSNRISAIAE